MLLCPARAALASAGTGRPVTGFVAINNIVDYPMVRLTLLAATAMIAATPLAVQATKAPEFVKMAGAGDLYEKTSSQMVLKTAKNDQVRSFAQMMISDHGKTTAQVKTAAKADKVKVPAPKLMPEQAQMIAELKAAKGADREKVYVRQQVIAHEKALALHTTYSQSGDKPALKQVAAGAVPIVKTHLDQVRTMQSAMGAM